MRLILIYRYFKYVWLLVGGWYVQFVNWKVNMVIFGVCVFGIIVMVWNLSVEREFCYKMFELGCFYLSRQYVDVGCYCFCWFMSIDFFFQLE